MEREQSYEEYMCEQADRMMEQRWYEEHKQAEERSEDMMEHPLFYTKGGEKVDMHIISF